MTAPEATDAIADDAPPARATFSRVIDLRHPREQPSDHRQWDSRPNRAHPGLDTDGLPSVSLVIPTLNEEHNLKHVLPRIPGWVDEVVIVDGRSTDATIAEAKRLRPDCVIVTDPEPGKGRALMTGMHASTGDIIITLDADGSMDPTEIPRFVYALLGGADFVKGSRFAHGGSTHDMGPVRRAGNRALVESVRRLYGGKFSDLCYGYNAMWRDVLPYLEGRAPGFEIETHMSVRALSAGMAVVEVPSFEAERINGTSNLRTFRDGFRVLRTILVERNRMAKASLPIRDEPRPHVPLRRDPDLAPPPVRIHTGRSLTVSAVVCTHSLDRWDDLLSAVVALDHQTVAPTEIVVVVDHNPDLLVRAKAGLHGVCVVANEQEQGLSGARNSAIAAARGEILAFLDDDARPDPDWIERLLDAYDSNDVLAVGGAVIPSWDTSRPRWLAEEFDWVVGCTYRGLPELRAPVRNLIGANMSFRRHVLDAVGGFDTTLGRIGNDGAGCEETELCIRAQEQFGDGRIVFEPAARVWHRVPAERTTWAYFAKRCRAEGRSKAKVVTLTDSGRGLAAERSYVTRTIPAGVVRNLGRAVHLDGRGLRNAASMVAGTALVGREYVRASRLGRN